MQGKKRGQRGAASNRAIAIGLIIVVIVLLIIYYRARHKTPEVSVPRPLPEMPNKPKPEEITFMGCPPDGDGRDHELNELKNRVDEGNYMPVAFGAVEKLPWPKGIEREPRTRWSSQDKAEVTQYEGIPISVEGYLADARLEGMESPNCHGEDPAMRDYHIWLTSGPGQDRTESVVVEATPRVRAKHPAWRIDAIKQLAHSEDRVRISGWLMLDPEHPDQVGKTRGTIWEIHPIMQIEVQRGGQWVSLDKPR